MQHYISGDSYYTDPAATRSIFNQISCGSRWSLYLPYFAVVLRARAVAVRGRYDDEQWALSSLAVMRAIERAGGRFAITGLEHLRAAAATPPYVLVGNHMSTLETQVMPVLVAQYMRVTFVVKHSLITNPFFGPVMRSRDPIAVHRRNPREDLEVVLREGAQHLAARTSLIIYPQATRTPVFSREQFNSLGVKLALHSGVPIIPFAVKTDFWGERGIFRGFGPIRRERTIHIEFGAPIRPEGRGKAEHIQIMDFIEQRLSQWGATRADTAGNDR